MIGYEVEFPGKASECGIVSDFVFGIDQRDAKNNFFLGKSLLRNWFLDPKNNCSESEVKLYHRKNLDNCENLSKMEIAEKLILFNGWFWDFGEDRFIEENFDKKKFEKAWKKYTIKAYQVSFNGYLDDEQRRTDIVFAKNEEEAKKAVAKGETQIVSDAFNKAQENGATYSDIRVSRYPDLDDCENIPAILAAERLIKKFGWCLKLSGNIFNKNNFDKKTFEKAWRDEYGEK